MIVLDCNAAIAIAMGTEYGNALSSLMLTGEKVIAPKQFCTELTHSLVKYVRGGYRDEVGAADLGERALGLVDEFYDDIELWREVLSESVRLNHSSYDVYYLVLARRTGATLFTLDKALSALSEQAGVNCIARGMI